MREIALFSAWNKEGLGTIARALEAQGYECVATGNTRTALEAEGVKVKDITELTGEPERFGGRVKTLHHKVFGGILFRPNRDEKEWDEGFRVGAVVCNFYPFVEKASQVNGIEELMEWVDIGGPSMVRAAAKNHKHVWVFTRTDQYARYIAAPEGPRDQDAALRLRERFALQAFEGVAELDAAIAKHFRWKLMGATQGGGTLTYGENPHQTATFTSNPVGGVKFVGPMSFNNIRDAEAAFRFAAAFKAPAVSVVKHQTLCGAAAGTALSAPSQVFRWAWEGDPVSRFGGIVGFNFLPGAEIQDVLRNKFLEVIVMPRSPGSERMAQDLHALKPKLRFALVDPVLYQQHLSGKPTEEIFQGWLGTLTQGSDAIPYDGERGGNVEAQHFDRFGQWAAACSKSNAIALAGFDAKSGVAYLAGVGQGQPNRLDALKSLALPRAMDFCSRMSVTAGELTCFSDAFLSHTDGLNPLFESGVRRLVQPGGSKADAEVTAEAARLGIEMKMTGVRHFWH